MNMVLNAIESMLSSPLGLIYMIILSDGWRFSRKTMQIVTPFFVIFLFALNAAIFWKTGITEASRSTISILNIILCGIFYCSVYKHFDGRLSFNFFSACLFIFIGDTISDSILYSTAKIHIVIKLLVFLLIALLLYLFFRKPFLEVFREIRHEWWWLMTVPMSLSFTFAMIIMAPGPLYQHPELQPQALLMCVSIVCVYVAFYVVFRSVRDRSRIEKNYQILQMQASFLKKHTDTLQVMDEQVKMHRHDMRHYANLINGCLESQDWKSMKQVLDAMNSNIEDSYRDGQMQIYTGESIIDGVLSFFAEMAKKDHVQFAVHLEVPPESKSDLTEFSVMLSNAIENAWNACKSMPEGMERIIRVTGRRQHGHYLLEITNTYSGEVIFDADGHPTTCREGHGYGTQSIVDFASRCHGVLKFSADNGWFLLQLMLPLQNVK